LIKFGIASDGFESIDMKKTPTSVPIFSLSKIKSGISFTHGAHQVAQKLTIYRFLLDALKRE
jgi:hypothetical protein